MHIRTSTSTNELTQERVVSQNPAIIQAYMHKYVEDTDIKRLNKNVDVYWT